MSFKGCVKCSNYTIVNFLGNKVEVCLGNVNYPEKCLSYRHELAKEQEEKQEV